MAQIDLPISGRPLVENILGTDLFVLARSGKTYSITHQLLTSKALADLLDVELLNLSDGAGLLYNAPSGKWQPAVGVMLASIYDTNNDGIVNQAAAAPWSGITGKPGTFTPSAHTHDDRYFTESELKTAGGGGNVHWDNLIGMPNMADGDMRKEVYDVNGNGIIDQAAMVLWSGVSGKPAVFPPSSHTHDDLYFTESELSVSGAGGNVHWDNIFNKPSLGVGDMLKFIYDQDDDGVVDQAAAVPWAGITNKPSTFPADPHNHNALYPTKTELSTSGQALVDWGNLASVPPTFTPSAHNHNDLYYTQSQLQAGTAQVHFNCLTNKPSSYAPSIHVATHQNGGVDELSVAGLSGVLADPQNANKLNGRSVADLLPTDGQVLVWNATQNYFEPADGGTGGSGGGHTIFDESLPLLQRDNLKFLGQNVCVVDDETDATLVKISDFPLVKDSLDTPLTVPEGYTMFVGPDFVDNDNLTVEGKVVVVGEPSGCGDLLSPLVNTEVVLTGATTLSDTAFSKMHKISGTTGNYTIDLPAVSGNAGKIISFRVESFSLANKLYTIAGNGSEKIDGETTRILHAGEVAILLCSGTEWNKLAGITVPFYCEIAWADASDPTLSNSLQALIMNTIIADPFAMGDLANSRISALRGGSYTAFVGARYYTHTAARNYLLLDVNGVSVDADEKYANNTALSKNISKPLYLNAGDYVSSRVQPGASVKIYTSGGSTARPYIRLQEIPSW